MTFSLMLWAPSWGGMLNGLLTLRGAWHKLRTDPVLKFFAAAVTFYGMATFEGPLLSMKSVNALAHYTDWIIGHVHSGAPGWNGCMAAGMIYWLVPRLWSKPLHSQSLANLHFWIGTVGILLHVAAMWTSGITQGLMLNATTEHGTVLAYPNFVDTLAAIRPMMLFRVLGGGLCLAGWLLSRPSARAGPLRLAHRLRGRPHALAAPAHLRVCRADGRRPERRRLGAVHRPPRESGAHPHNRRALLRDARCGVKPVPRASGEQDRAPCSFRADPARCARRDPSLRLRGNHRTRPARRGSAPADFANSPRRLRRRFLADGSGPGRERDFRVRTRRGVRRTGRGLVEGGKTMASPSEKPPSCASLWIGVGIVFALLVLAWSAMFYFASKHRAAEVPLTASPAR